MCNLKIHKKTIKFTYLLINLKILFENFIYKIFILKYCISMFYENYIDYNFIKNLHIISSNYFHVILGIY